ncbi:predicted protein [Chaetoceros tenuissimus]|uniref:Uncharacterized protein n=1 Tax=Chaetoceros tenuissimus TaxID=426638 RepID=A0AAD3CV89_9STRA|nr:predicted protein [Chaetoceros tenuissimus]
MISHIKQNRYQRRRLFREDNETTAVSFQRIEVDVPFDMQRQKSHVSISTNRRTINQMVRSFPDDREARTMQQANTEIRDSSYALSTSIMDHSTISSMITSHESSPSSTSGSRSDGGFGRQEESSIIEMIDEILSN